MIGAMHLTFLGANRQVTGSRYLLEVAGLSLLIDCGMFQERDFQHRNFERPPFEPGQIDAVLLTHAHLDHCGLLPRLVRDGFRGPIWTQKASVELAALVLADAARLQGEDVRLKERRHQREGRRSQHPYEPLYSPEDAAKAIRQFRGVAYDQAVDLGHGVTATCREAGHVLGSASIEVDTPDGRIVFSGDVGVWDKPLIRDPARIASADFLVMESTYGDSTHDRTLSIEDQLAPLINDTVQRGGNVVIPTFAIERAQELLYHLNNLLGHDRIPHLLAFLDSPMAVTATTVFQEHTELLDREAAALLKRGDDPLDFPGLVLSRTSQQSKGINRVRGSCIIMAGSGMCTGGRIKHHLERNLPNPRSTILFVGYQAEGTLGRVIQHARHDEAVRIFNRPVPVRAKIANLSGMSAHADEPALVRWLSAISPKPRHIFLTHGEPAPAERLANTLRGLGYTGVEVPAYGHRAELRA